MTNNLNIHPFQGLSLEERAESIMKDWGYDLEDSLKAVRSLVDSSYMCCMGNFGQTLEKNMESWGCIREIIIFKLCPFPLYEKYLNS